MTLPATLYELPTLEAHLTGAGEPVAESYQCPTCPRVLPALGIVSTAGLPGTLPAWVCTTCASAAFREGKAAEAAAAAEAAGPDWTSTRASRDMLLTRCDWTQIPDAPLDELARTAWATYRQALRDITATFATPAAVVWPDPPT